MTAVKRDPEAVDIWSRRITRVLTRFMRFFSAHWLAFANVAVALYVGLPFLAPLLMHTGHVGMARLLYLLFRPLCHQLPERSYFLFGRSATYGLADLAAHLGGLASSRFTGDAVLGFKVAVCERCVAIYGSMLVTGLAFTCLRRRLRPLPFRGFALLVLPVALDGTGQLFHLWSSTWLSRSVTGVLFGLACTWLAYPYLERGMAEVQAAASSEIKEWST